MSGRRFWKMSGSGNDFVFFDCMVESAGSLATSSVISAICERRTGVGADGVVLLEPHPERAFLMRYFNRDGSLAEMCGNAALCSTRLATELRIAPGGDFWFQTVSGPVRGRFRDGSPEIDMVAVTELRTDAGIDMIAGERRLGFVRVGVPHLVVQVDDVERVDVVERGRALRHHPSLRDGANANFVSQAAGGAWRIRTYERGVEDETLACGTGAVGTVALLNAWGSVSLRAALTTRSGRVLEASVAGPEGGAPVLRGEGRIVFEGLLGELGT